MGEKGGKSPVNGDAEKGKEKTEESQKSVENLSAALETEKQLRAALQERFDEAEREKSRLARRVEVERNRAEIEKTRADIDKEQLDDVTEQLKREKKRREEGDAAHKERENVLQREQEKLNGVNELLKEEVEGLRGEKEVLKREKEKTEGDNTGLRSALEECENEKKQWKIEKENLMKRMREMEEAKSAHVKETGENSTQTEDESTEFPIEPKEEPVDDGSQLIDRDNRLFDLDFMQEDMKYEMDFNEEEKPNDEMHIKEEEIFNENWDGLGDDINFIEEETPNDDVNIGMSDADLAMDYSFIDPSNDMQNLGTLSDVRGSTLGEKNSLNDLSSNFENVNNIALSEDSHGIEDVEKMKRSSRKSSKLKYSDSMEDSDEDGKPLMKKSKSESGKRSEIKRKSSKKRQEMSASGENAKKNNTDLDCIECEYRTRSVTTLVEHLRIKHKTNLILAGHALLCECGHESYSKRHSYECGISKFTIIRKRDGPVQRLDDEKVTPQCILCEMHPKTALGYALHLRIHHKSTLKENRIYCICSCGYEVRSDNLKKHSKECNGRQFTLHKLDEK